MQKNLVIRTFYITTLAFLATILSCNKDIPNDGIPAYIHISETSVVTEPGQGSNSHNITDIWPQVGKQDLGVYELPTTFPVLAEGEQLILVRAGIKDNGIAATRVIYPFYRLDTMTVNMVKAETINYTPEFSYAINTQFALNEGFETGNSFDNMTRTTNSSEVFEGIGSGLIVLNDLNPTVEAKTSDPFEIPFGASTYIELNYKNNNFFTIRLQGVDNSGQTITIEKIFIAPKDDWNKIYINISNEIGQLRADKYNIIIAANKSESITEAKIFIDNFKVVHF